MQNGSTALKNKVITQKLVTYGHELGQTLGDGEGQGGPRAAVHGVTKCRTQQGDATKAPEPERFIKKAPFAAEPLIQGPLASTFSPPPWGCSAGRRTCPCHHPRPRALEPVPGGSCTPEEEREIWGSFTRNLLGALEHKMISYSLFFSRVKC